jgi:hypothetical protein
MLIMSRLGKSPGFENAIASERDVLRWLLANHNTESRGFILAKSERAPG